MSYKVAIWLYDHRKYHDMRLILCINQEKSRVSVSQSIYSVLISEEEHCLKSSIISYNI